MRPHQHHQAKNQDTPFSPRRAPLLIQSVIAAPPIKSFALPVVLCQRAFAPLVHLRRVRVLAQSSWHLASPCVAAVADTLPQIMHSPHGHGACVDQAASPRTDTEFGPSSYYSLQVYTYCRHIRIQTYLSFHGLETCTPHFPRTSTCLRVSMLDAVTRFTVCA